MYVYNVCYNQVLLCMYGLNVISYEIIKPLLIQEGRVIVFNATFNNISIISWQSVLLVEETRVP